MRQPARLSSGDTVGIVSPSSPIETEAVDRMVGYFQARGYRTRVAPHVLDRFGFLAGSAQARAGDLNSMLRDPAVRMVMTSMGGCGAPHLLPLLDYAALAADPKIVVGLSDPSILLNALTATSGVVTIHGPNGVEFGGLCPLTPFAEDNFWPLVAGELLLPHAFPLGAEAHTLRRRPDGLTAGVEGRLFGGTASLVQLLIGTRWAPDWSGVILFLEEVNVRLETTDRILSHFRLAGVLDQIAGLIIGVPLSCEPSEAETLDDVVLRLCAGTRFPIVSGVLVGHTDDKITLPLGCRVRLDPAGPLLELLEPATCREDHM